MEKFKALASSILKFFSSWQERNQAITEILKKTETDHETLKTVSDSIKSLNTNISSLANKMELLDSQVKTMNDKITTIGNGTKMELFETLHNMRQRLVIEEGMATALDKKEVEEIFHLYHDKLGGNGQGQRYYNEIMALPESLAEKEALNNA